MVFKYIIVSEMYTFDTDGATYLVTFYRSFFLIDHWTKSWLQDNEIRNTIFFLLSGRISSKLHGMTKMFCDSGGENRYGKSWRAKMTVPPFSSTTSINEFTRPETEIFFQTSVFFIVKECKYSPPSKKKSEGNFEEKKITKKYMQKKG